MLKTHHRLTNAYLPVLLILLTAFTNFAKAQTEKLTVNFDYDKHALTAETKNTLDQTCARLLTANLLQITLSGHTDADGTEGYNNTLAENRARAVYNYLISKGIPANKIIVASWGEGKPVAANNNEGGKHQNRRVDILIQTEAPKPVQAQVAKPQPVITDIHQHLGKPSQFFNVSANSAITVTGNEGTVLHFPAGALVNGKGETVTGNVTIELKEFYKTEDILAAKLNTTSNGQLLVSGGMIYVTAKANGEELKLNGGKELQITFKDAPVDAGMQTFNGVPDNSGNLNWVPYTAAQISPEPQATSLTLPQIQPALPKTRKREKISVNVKGFMWGAKVERQEGVRDIPVEKNSVTDELVLYTAELNWINCDRFYEVKEKTRLTVQVPGELQPSVYLVFKDIKAVMRSSKNGTEITFENVPVGHRATIIAMTMVDNEAYYTEREVIITNNQQEHLTLLKTAMYDLKEQLAQLN